MVINEMERNENITMNDYNDIDYDQYSNQTPGMCCSPPLWLCFCFCLYFITFAYIKSNREFQSHVYIWIDY